jgi:hemerythrin-like domain-containing protein
LQLHARNGLPDAIAYLRGGHPRTQWSAHQNYSELSAFWLQVHDSLRVHGEDLGGLTQAFRAGRWSAADFQRIFVPRLNQFLQHLNMHHQIEDNTYFPRFRALDPRMAAGFDLLANDHGVIHEALLASAESARGLLAVLAADQDAVRRGADDYASASERLLALLLRHLSDEEDLVIPAMLEHGERSVV